MVVRNEACDLGDLANNDMPIVSPAMRIWKQKRE